jgi:hypothetical protein
MNILDGSGLYGSLLGYGLTFAYAGSAFLIFIYLLCKGRLGFDEEASLEMMKIKDSDEQ